MASSNQKPSISVVIYTLYHNEIIHHTQVFYAFFVADQKPS